MPLTVILVQLLLSKAYSDFINIFIGGHRISKNIRVASYAVRFPEILEVAILFVNLDLRLLVYELMFNLWMGNTSYHCLSHS